MATTTYDALIVGSGPTGLSIALGLSRIHRRAAIFTKPGGAGFRNEGAHGADDASPRDAYVRPDWSLFLRLTRGSGSFLKAAGSIRWDTWGTGRGTVLAGLDMITQLGVEIEDDPILGQSVKTDPLFATNVPGVSVAGDAATPMKVVANAMGSGSTVAAGIVQQLVAEDMEILLAEKKPVD